MTKDNSEDRNDAQEQDETLQQALKKQESTRVALLEAKIANEVLIKNLQTRLTSQLDEERKAEVKLQEEIGKLDQYIRCTKPNPKTKEVLNLNRQANNQKSHGQT